MNERPIEHDHRLAARQRSDSRRRTMSEPQPSDVAVAEIGEIDYLHEDPSGIVHGNQLDREQLVDCHESVES